MFVIDPTVINSSPLNAPNAGKKLHQTIHMNVLISSPLPKNFIKTVSIN